MTTKFTPGPWLVFPHYCKEDSESIYAQTWLIGIGQYDTIAEVRPGHDAFDNHNDANARLIATAPELLEALAPFAKVAEHDIGEDEADVDLFRPMSKHNHAPLLTVGDFRRALTAIAKATGQ